jgi:hypothetical protein
VAACGPPQLHSHPPFAPLAEVKIEGMTPYINCERQTFVPDAAGTLIVQTKTGELRLKELR